ncbi:peptidoglycan -binding protein [Octadecabacter ascidiaceicola]|uniref:Motility protein B n=1 Tax=Octadecabacter ascidiaceicola TaxID=1655543 RepID=A0A238K395_9RHOB|nr:peptidoglycan -binding protein [Octadecabacter ascidiaceicola]SMX36864.1 Motility protein B [Octadecabacter ascidiaceicola]
MALSRRTGARFQASIWPGFVDAMTGLLLVLMFVLTIFMVLQFVLRETITGQEAQLDSLEADVLALTNALGIQQDQSAALGAQVGVLSGELAGLQAELAESESLVAQQNATIARLTGERDALIADVSNAQSQITGFEAQVAGLLAQRRDAEGAIASLEAREAELMSSQEALNLALAQARDEIDEGVEAARLAAARADALDAMIAELEADNTASSTQISELEAAKLADAAAAEALRERLANADTELTAMTLALEEQRQRAEDTLTLLAAAQAQSGAAEEVVDRQEALLALANEALAQEEALSAESQRQVTLLNEQVAGLRGELERLQGLLNLANEQDATANVQIETLTQDLNTAMARALLAERRARVLEEAELERLAAEAIELERYRSDFLGLLREVLEDVEGVRIEGDRFVFSSEVLFEQGAAALSDEGQREIAKVAGILRDVAGDIPEDIDWVIRVDGHTDNVPLSGAGQFANNWELSQARALSVVLYMVNFLGIPPERLAANGFGQYQPINPDNSDVARAQNRRIELKLTER